MQGSALLPRLFGPFVSLGPDGIRNSFRDGVHGGGVGAAAEVGDVDDGIFIENMLEAAK